MSKRLQGALRPIIGEYRAMTPQRGGQERRAFGRRRTHLHGFIHTSGRPPAPCIVRNVSEGGALLELSDPSWLPSYFTLSIDSDGFSATCEIRHKSNHGAGVFFETVRIKPGGTDSRFAKRTMPMAGPMSGTDYLNTDSHRRPATSPAR